MTRPFRSILHPTQRKNISVILPKNQALNSHYLPYDIPNPTSNGPLSIFEILRCFYDVYSFGVRQFHVPTIASANDRQRVALQCERANYRQNNGRNAALHLSIAQFAASAAIR